MMQLTIEVDRRSIRKLQEALGTYGKQYRRELAIATNRASQGIRTYIAGEIYRTLTARKGVIKKKVPLIKRAKASDIASKSRRARATSSAIIRVNHEERLPLGEFRPNQTRKGVSYKIDRSGPRKTIPGAFMGPTPKSRNIKWHRRGSVYIRKGASRYPLRRIYGVSPWGVFVRRGLKTPAEAFGRARLRREILERIRTIRLKNEGVIRR
jgi:hypothetical protein